MDLLILTEAAKFLSIKESRLRYAIFKKEIPFIKIGRLIRFDRQELIKWLEDQKVVINNKEKK
jgi:excisionase family DNA binding protein